jgi:NADPH:quinone reductase-like Zn-dependent oxidoreductase
MRCVYLVSHGRADSIVVDARPDPIPQPGEVVVKISAAALNRVDLYMRDSGKGITHNLPLIMGVDGVGEIVDASASSLRPGERFALYPALYCGSCPYCLRGDPILCRSMRILGEHRDGAFAEFVAVPSRNLFPVPDHLSDAEAAALITGHLTAWRMVRTQGAVGPGQTVLIHGVGGGVALAALQLSAMAGARVIATTTGTEKLEHARTLGAAVIDYRTDNVVETVLDLTAGAGVDVVIDNVGEATWGQSLRCLARGGRLVTCGATTGAFPPADLQRVFIRQLRIQGSTLGNPGEFAALLAAVAQHRLRPMIHARYSLEAAHEALGVLEAGQQFGKIVLDIQTRAEQSPPSSVNSAYTQTV